MKSPKKYPPEASQEGHGLADSQTGEFGTLNQECLQIKLLTTLRRLMDPWHLEHQMAHSI